MSKTKKTKIEVINYVANHLNSLFTVLNNDIKSISIWGGLHKTDFNPIYDITDLLLSIPKDSYLSCNFNNSMEENSFILELVSSEYSLCTSDIEVQNRVGMQFKTIIDGLVDILTGDKIYLNIDKIVDCVHREDFAVNGRVRTVYVCAYEVRF